jgi:hypothetical protein
MGTKPNATAPSVCAARVRQSTLHMKTGSRLTRPDPVPYCASDPDYCAGAAGSASTVNVCDGPIGVTVVPTILPIDAR